MTYYTHRYSNVGNLAEYECIANYDNGSSAVSDPSNEVEWIALGNTPAKVSGNRFISIVEKEIFNYGKCKSNLCS